MNIEVKNLGIIGSGFVNTSKPLILMCGPNSTGKTYLSYIIYAIHSLSPRYSGKTYDKIRHEFLNTGKCQLSKELFDELLNSESVAIKGMLPSIFSITDSDANRMFKYFKLSLTISSQQYENDIVKPFFSYKIVSGDDTLEVRKEKNSSELNFKANGSFDASSKLNAYLTFLSSMAFHALSHAGSMAARMLTVERNSIYTFNKELSISRNDLIDRLQDVINQSEITQSERGISMMLRNGSQRYPLAVSDSLKIANDLENIQKSKSAFYDFAIQLEKELLHGSISVNKYGSVEFNPAFNNRKRLPIQVASSIVKTLSSLIIYLKHLAAENDLLIIDEPEMNLHPDNQILLTRIFAKLVNRGLRLVISTHSDYIIRELNNLVMAREVMAREVTARLADGSVARTSYPVDTMLDKERMEVLYFKFNAKGKARMERIPLDEYGFEIASIDKAINDQNRITQDLFDILKYGEDE